MSYVEYVVMLNVVRLNVIAPFQNKKICPKSFIKLAPGVDDPLAVVTVVEASVVMARQLVRPASL